MQLYRFEVTTKKSVFNVVVAAENNEAAFQTADAEVENHFLKMPEIVDVTLHEKKKIRQKGSGFVLDEHQSVVKD
jgi:hypothetical protein